MTTTTSSSSSKETGGETDTTTSSTMTTTAFHQFVPLAAAGMVLSFFVAALCGGGLAAMAVSYSTILPPNSTPTPTVIHTSSEYHPPVDQQQQQQQQRHPEGEEALLQQYQARIESLEMKLTQLTTAFTTMEMLMNKNKNKNNDHTGAAAAAARTSAAGGAAGTAVVPPATTGRRRILEEYAEWKQRPPLTAVETERVLLDLDPRESMPDNDLVCTQFHSWVLEQVFTSFQNNTQVPTNRTIIEDNAVGSTAKHTLYQPTAPSIRLCNTVNICPEPTEEMGVLGAKYVSPAAGVTLESSRGTEWADHMVLVDPYTMVSEEDGKPITYYRSSFSYTAYYYHIGDGDENRIQEFPVTGGTGRFASASGYVMNGGSASLENKDTKQVSIFQDVTFTVCVPPPKKGPSPGPSPGPPPPKKKKSKKNNPKGRF